MIFVWCLYDIYMVSVWYLYGVPYDICMVSVWYLYGVCMIFVWCLWYLYGVCMKFVWCLYDICMVSMIFVWCLYDICMVSVWYLYDICMVSVFQPWSTFLTRCVCGSQRSSWRARRMLRLCWVERLSAVQPALRYVQVNPRWGDSQAVSIHDRYPLVTGTFELNLSYLNKIRLCNAELIGQIYLCYWECTQKKLINQMK